MYSLYPLDVRITPGGVDELPLIAIEVKNQQNQLNWQENKSIRTKHVAKDERSLWRVVGCWKKPRQIRKVQRRGLSETKMGKTRSWRLQMEEPGSYEALLAGYDLSGRSRWPKGLSRALTRHQRADAWWLPRREKSACVGAWVTLCRRFFLRWVDQAEVIPKVRSSARNNVVGKVA